VITSELLRGYRIGERIVRPSMVKVSASRAAGRPAAAVEPLDVSEETVDDQVENAVHDPELES